MRPNQQITNVTLSVETINAVLNYLSTRPWNDVNNLINAIQHEVNQNLRINQTQVEEPEVKEPKTDSPKIEEIKPKPKK